MRGPSNEAAEELNEESTEAAIDKRNPTGMRALSSSRSAPMRPEGLGEREVQREASEPDERCVHEARRARRGGTSKKAAEGAQRTPSTMRGPSKWRPQSSMSIAPMRPLQAR